MALARPPADPCHSASLPGTFDPASGAAGIAAGSSGSEASALVPAGNEPSSPTLNLIATALDGTVVAVPASSFHRVSAPSPQPEAPHAAAAISHSRSGCSRARQGRLCLPMLPQAGSAGGRQPSSRAQAVALISCSSPRCRPPPSPASSSQQQLPSDPLGAILAPAAGSAGGGFPGTSVVLQHPLPRQVAAILAHPQHAQQLLVLGACGSLQVGAQLRMRGCLAGWLTRCHGLPTVWDCYCV
jgi:hypothetical protein